MSKNVSVAGNLESLIPDFLRPKDPDYYRELIDDWFDSIKEEEFEQAMRETNFFYAAAKLIAKRHGLDKLLHQIPKQWRTQAWLNIEAALQRKAQVYEKWSGKEESVASSIVSALLESDD